MSSSVQYTEEESSLSAIGVLTYGRLLKHIADLHVESIQRLMRPVLQKLMQHPRNVNIFNQPVDHVGLGIPDYLVKIPIPMDLGTVKSRLLRGEYSNVETCATDITLVFQNAITYNPPTHVVHQIALIMKEEFEAEMELVRERCSKESDRKNCHECSLCQGACCPLCGEKCLKFEPPVLVCHGTCGQRIKRNSVFYVSPDGCRSWCQRCQTSLGSVVSEDVDEEDQPTVLWKKDLLKRKFDEEVAEPWAQCDICSRWVHQICGLFNDRYNADSAVDKEQKVVIKYCCPLCKLEEGLKPVMSQLIETCQKLNESSESDDKLSVGSVMSPRQRGVTPRGRSPRHALTSPRFQHTTCTMNNIHNKPSVLRPTAVFDSSATEVKDVPKKHDLESESLSRSGRNQTLSHTVQNRHLGLKSTECQRLQCLSADSIQGGERLLSRYSGMKKESGRIKSDALSLRDRSKSLDEVMDLECNGPQSHPESESELISPVLPYNDCVDSTNTEEMELQEDAVTSSEESPLNVMRAEREGEEEEDEEEDEDNEEREEIRKQKFLANESTSHWYADTLPRTRLSDFIECVVRDRLRAMKLDEAIESITIRVTSGTDHYIEVSDIIHTNLITRNGDRVPRYMPYRQRCIMLFQRIDGVDVCLFTLYVQEFDESCPEPNKSRVYIAYLDSVEYFRPREARTVVYHEIIVGYLKWAQMRGFKQGHLWACPPQRGDSFIFWCHPPHQRTPTRERLSAWYAAMLHRASRMGVLDSVGTMWSEFFSQYSRRDEGMTRTAAKYSLVGMGLLGKPSATTVSSSIPPSSRVPDSTSSQCSSLTADPSLVPVCPPVFEGDFWVNECMRVHRVVKSRARCCDGDDRNANQRKSRDLLKALMSKPQAGPFNQPVNPVTLNIPTYFDVIKQPMDLGTIRNNLRTNKYMTMLEFVEDIRLTFNNAMLFNPYGHFIHTLARDLLTDIETKISDLVSTRIDTEKEAIDLQLVNQNLALYPLGLAVETVTASSGVVQDRTACDGGSVAKESPQIAGGGTDPSRGSERRVVIERRVSFEALDRSSSVAESEPLMTRSDNDGVDGETVEVDEDLQATSDGGGGGGGGGDGLSISCDETEAEGEGEGEGEDMIGGDSSEGERTPRRFHRAESMESVLSNQSSCWGAEAWAQRPLLSLGRGVTGPDCPIDPLADTPFEKPRLGIKGVNALMNELSKNVNRLKDDLFVMTFSSDREVRSVDGSSLVDKETRALADSNGVFTPVPCLTPSGKMSRSKGRVAALLKRCATEPRENFSAQALALLDGLKPDTSDPDPPSYAPFVDCRHTFLEMCQFRHYQFDTLRRAKHSSLLLLYHLHNPTLKNLRPHCQQCTEIITDVRWHCDQCANSCDVCNNCIESGYEHHHPLIPKRVTFI
eukprot:CAMPEP_0182439702 /NCGR_PEP_ID=MMETSP1167-20130531/86595_1 /TAXON_ID=2988 /ORGANISM="Mallomonas Sp, Strain CCMP3275" /LENGTH=1396 /DNA_ID=CAMNT_0024633453 /DNA_START=440 /DNA_END=4630 /DNA_ORIENTATION=-